MTSYGSYFSAKEIVSDELVCTTLDAGDCDRLNVNSLLDTSAPTSGDGTATGTPGERGDTVFHYNDGGESALWVCVAADTASDPKQYTWAIFGQANASGV